jgi:hypothetical protein
VKVDAKVIGDRREVFICQLYNTVSNDVLLAFLDLWEKLGDLVVEKTA